MGNFYPGVEKTRYPKKEKKTKRGKRKLTPAEEVMKTIGANKGKEIYLLPETAQMLRRAMNDEGELSCYQMVSYHADVEVDGEMLRLLKVDTVLKYGRGYYDVPKNAKKILIL